MKAPLEKIWKNIFMVTDKEGRNDFNKIVIVKGKIDNTSRLK